MSAAPSAIPGPGPTRRGIRLPQWVALGVLVLFLVGAPSFVDSFTLSQILTKALWLGIAAASLIFLLSLIHI